jgi:carbamoyl-phosphate synthase large subunit
MAEMSFAVTGMNATDNPAPGIAVIRAIRSDARWQGRAIGLAYDALDTGVYDPELCDRVFLIPYPTEREQGLLARLEYIAAEAPFQVLIPTLDAELVNFIRLRHELEPMGIRMLLPTEEQLAMRSKAKLSEFAHAQDVPFPLTIAVTAPGELAAAMNTLGVPFVVKGCFYEAQVCHTLEQAHTAYYAISGRWGLPILAQAYLPGEEYDVCALADPDGKLAGAVAMRKLRLTDKGKAWAGITIQDEELLDLSRRIVEGLGWTGPMEIEFIRAATDHRYHLFEINPRFPAWCYLTAGCGLNLPMRYLQLAMGETVKASLDYRPGIIFVRHATDIICGLDVLEALTTRGEVARATGERRSPPQRGGDRG